mgnify:CR=1
MLFLQIVKSDIMKHFQHSFNLITVLPFIDIDIDMLHTYMDINMLHTYIDIDMLHI